MMTQRQTSLTSFTRMSSEWFKIPLKIFKKKMIFLIIFVKIREGTSV